MSKRIDYIDVIKGLTIFGVVWVHTVYPQWLTALLVNSIFFFLSGFFFKKKPLKTFFSEKVRSLLIPFSFFYLISYSFRILLHYWDYRTLSTFDWGCIFDVFECSANPDYLFVNVPLWFLLCIFVIQILYCFISYLNKWQIAIIALLCLCFKSFFYSIPAPFMINVACYYLGFFALGNLVGKPWIEKLKDIRFRKVSLGVSLLLCAALFIPIDALNGWRHDMAYHVKLFMVFFVLMSMASWFNEKRWLSLVRLYGENSLIILGVHVLPLIILIRLTNKVFGYCTPMIGFFQSIIVMAVMYVVILFCNKYIPFLVGKRVR